MQEIDVIPEIRQIIGAMLYAAKEPLTLADIRRVLEQTAELHGGPAKDFVQLTDVQLREALAGLKSDLETRRIGFHVTEVANGYRLQNDAACGAWLRVLLERGRPNRLSKPALETLAIIAYRQPCTRAEIEAVRGVAVDQIVRNLLDMQLIRITGRSELPGRPWQFGTTQKFLEYFGLKDVSDLPGIDELRRMEADQLRKKEAQQATDAAPTVSLAKEEPTMSKMEDEDEDVVDDTEEELEEEDEFEDDDEEEDSEEEEDEEDEEER